MGFATPMFRKREETLEGNGEGRGDNPPEKGVKQWDLHELVILHGIRLHIDISEINASIYNYIYQRGTNTNRRMII